MYMEIQQASLNHIELIADFAEQCVGDSTENYRRALADPKEYLNFLVARAKWTHESKEGYLPSTTYFAIDNNKIVGAIRLRTGRNDTADNEIGYVGYETRPSSRNKGVATFLLTWVVEHLVESSVIITCEDSNLASRHLLEKAGAKFIGTFHDKANDVSMRRYQISKRNADASNC